MSPVKHGFGDHLLVAALRDMINGQVASLRVVAEQAAAPQPQIDKPHVLLVEDDAAERGATRMLLEVEGYDVTAVASFSQALQSARNDADLDVLVTDYHLSKAETGIQLITALRESLGAPLKAVLMTGDTFSAIKQLSRDPHLQVASKPIIADELLNLPRGLLVS